MASCDLCLSKDVVDVVCLSETGCCAAAADVISLPLVLERSKLLPACRCLVNACLVRSVGWSVDPQKHVVTATIANSLLFLYDCRLRRGSMGVRAP